MRNSRQIWVSGVVAALSLWVTLVRADEQLVTLKYVRTDIRKAIGMLETVSGLRVVLDPRVPARRITLSLKDLPPEDALRTVASAAGLTCRPVGNGFVVEPKRPQRPGPGGDKRSGAAGFDVTVPALHAAPRLGSGIIQPNGGPAPGGPAGARPEREVGVAVSPGVVEALERPVEVEVKNGPLTAVTEQLSRSAGVKVTVDPTVAPGLVAAVGLHGIPLKGALEAVAGQTGLQISPRPDGVAFVRPGVSLDEVQTRQRSTPEGARRVDQGQLWTAEWSSVLTSGISAADQLPTQRSLRRQPLSPDEHPFEFKPRRGSIPAAPAAAGGRPSVPERLNAGKLSPSADGQKAQGKRPPVAKQSTDPKQAKARKGAVKGRSQASPHSQ